MSSIKCCTAFCGVGSDLEIFFQKIGSVTNATSVGAHHDQSAGYYSGGGFSVRNRIKNFQPTTLQLPNIKAGCGGIDIFTGGFSFVNSAQLVNAIKSIGSSAVSYGFMLAMKTFAPSVQSVLTELQDMANKVNQHGINSCEMAATLVGGAWPKSDVASSHVCASLGSSDGMFKSWVAAKHECGAGGKRSEVLRNTSNRPGYQSILVEEFNVAWEVIKRNSYLISDTELAYLCMTISGTIVAYKDGDNRRAIGYPSKITNDLIKCLFEGGTVSGYGCADNSGKCLKIQEKQFKISSGGFATKVRKMLQDITKKAISDEPLTKNEIDFISKVRLPIYKLINVLTSYKRAEFDLRDFTDIICVDLIHQYISDILDVMIEETVHLKNAQVSDAEIDKFLKQLHEAKENINKKRKVAYAQMNQMLMVIETATIYEKKLESTFETLQRNDELNHGMR